MSKWTRLPDGVSIRGFRIAGLGGTLQMSTNGFSWYGDDEVHAFDCSFHMGWRGFLSCIREMRDEIRKERRDAG